MSEIIRRRKNRFFALFKTKSSGKSITQTMHIDMQSTIEYSIDGGEVKPPSRSASYDKARDKTSVQERLTISADGGSRRHDVEESMVNTDKGFENILQCTKRKESLVRFQAFKEYTETLEGCGPEEVSDNN
eukprot:TRINITY_DN6865_c0_g1_i1.p1 TRINITY_DN6865_c0_g1~~TRINITY_DN6865_c0_g1_i1.p1  ORF type:complete len:131 (-),score=27.20 TRINITY_DN6865_c0_g1_i1:158-550(-)